MEETKVETIKQKKVLDYLNQERNLNPSVIEKGDNNGKGKRKKN